MKILKHNLSVLNTVYVLDMLINSKVKAHIFRYYYEGEHITLKKPCYVANEGWRVEYYLLCVLGPQIILIGFV